MRVATDSKPRLAGGVRLQEDKARGGHVLLAPERVLQANRTAVEVLKLCNGERSFDGIVDELASRFAVERGRIATEAAALLHELATKRMVEL
jgi:pyrroloquinoline quinone biosynthesis protein D